VQAGQTSSRNATEAILFDFGGTLDADGLPWSARFHAAYMDGGGRRPHSWFAPLFAESDRRLAEAPGIRSLGFRATLDAQAVFLLELLRAEGESLDPHTVAESVHRAAVAVANRNRPLLACLAADRPLGLISNFTGNLVPCLEELDLRAPFTVVCDSGALGIEKPDPAIFRMALTALGARAEACWMVGDNPDADLIPAAALGLSTCWVAPASDQRTFSAGVPTARIVSLLALPDALRVPCTV
jgi:FMN hydrolase / 5-amino-6-(5-phospho-D-ribitylamino)uracil phosphatase